MFLDASAIVAMIGREPDADALAARMKRDNRRMTSPLAIWEAVAALARLSGRSPTDVREDVKAFLTLARVQVLAVPPQAADLAIDALDRYGKGRHPAALNFGDCFAYASARYYRQPLLYKGEDFPKTDIEAA